MMSSKRTNNLIDLRINGRDVNEIVQKVDKHHQQEELQDHFQAVQRFDFISRLRQRLQSILEHVLPYAEHIVLHIAIPVHVTDVTIELISVRQ